jgi:hypothetical protein
MQNKPQLSSYSSYPFFPGANITSFPPNINSESNHSVRAQGAATIFSPFYLAYGQAEAGNHAFYFYVGRGF